MSGFENRDKKCLIIGGVIASLRQFLFGRIEVARALGHYDPNCLFYRDIEDAITSLKNGEPPEYLDTGTLDCICGTLQTMKVTPTERDEVFPWLKDRIIVS